MATTLVFVTAFCIVAVLVYMGRYSGRVRVAQSRLIDAPIEQVYAQVADLAKWPAWCPWLDSTTQTQCEVSSPADTRGSVCRWTGDRAAQGVVEHRRMLSGVSILQRVRLQHPFTVPGRFQWTFADRAGKTEVTWSLRGRVAFSMRAFASTVNGAMAFDLRYGLDRLASLLEPDQAPRYALTYRGVHEVALTRYVYQTYSGPFGALAQAVGGAVKVLRQQLSDAGITPTGEPIAVYVKTNIKLRTTVCHIGLPIGGADAGALPVREFAAHNAYRVDLQGDYGALEIAWYLAMQRLTQEAIRPDQRIAPFECYRVGPEAVASNPLQTELYIPVVNT
jgi:uncharacterized protein YndB with AHSA1/START domain